MKESPIPRATHDPFKGNSDKEHWRRPEWIANPPLEHTTLVYSIPFRGEWDNGHVLRLLHGMLSQKTEKGCALEIELIANRSGLEHLLDKNDGDSASRGKKEAVDKLRQTQSAIEFLQRVVAVQKRARDLPDTKKQTSDGPLQQILATTDDQIQKDILTLAIKKANDISIAVLDTTKINFAESPYKGSGISSVRTIGMDCAMVRFEENKNVAISMFDVDTVPLDTGTVRELQRLYESDPKLTYVFSSMSDMAKGISRNVASNPTMDRHIDYNRWFGHGSPQISFRLNAYEKLKEISNQYIIGDEDRDTGARLIYHFGALQDGLLFETSHTLTSSPRVLTADRIDGFVDGSAANERSQKKQERYGIENDLKEIAAFRQKVLQLIESLPTEEKQKAVNILENARKKELQRERVQQRMNRSVISAFFKATERGWIRREGKTTVVDEANLSQLQSGKALQFFLRMNPVIVSEVLDSPDDQAMLKYYAGIEPNYPKTVEQPTYMHRAMRDYLGEILSYDELLKQGLCQVTEKNEEGRTHVDNRTREARMSFWHGMTAELLALGHTYRVFFQTKSFLKGRSVDNWPQTAGGPEGSLRFGSLDERLAQLKLLDAEVTVEPEREPKINKTEPAQAESDMVDTNKTEPVKEAWTIGLSFASIPGYTAFKRLFGRSC